jgi:hypothetical protein
MLRSSPGITGQYNPFSLPIDILGSVHT